ncbi:MAG: glycosyltransferase [Nitrospirae bacterium]|nr:glycosyltransferase [Nitrospirota bacterium]
MKNILMISYHFPPENSGGVGRPYSLYKYLPGSGYRVIVITQSLYGRLPDESHIYRFDAEWRKSALFTGKGISKVFSKLLYVAGLVPVNNNFWTENVLRGADDILMKHKPALIYATYPPVHGLALGLRLSRENNVPMISEFRDGFLFEPVLNLNPRQKRLMTRFEEDTVKQSSAVITIGENLSEYFSRKYKKKDVYTVHNGFDRDDFALSAGDGRVSKCRIVHFGAINFSRKRSITNLLKAVRRLKDENKISGDNFELSFIGRYTSEERDLIDGLALGDVINLHGPMDKSAGFKKISSEYKYLLFFGVEGETSVISSKLPEYLNLQKPIMGICRGNEAERIIKRTGTGEVFDFDEGSIYSAFLKCLDGNLFFRPNSNEIEKFDRQRQSRRIAEIIDRTLKS